MISHIVQQNIQNYGTEMTFDWFSEKGKIVVDPCTIDHIVDNPMRRRLRHQGQEDRVAINLTRKAFVQLKREEEDLC